MLNIQYAVFVYICVFLTQVLRSSRLANIGLFVVSIHDRVVNSRSLLSAITLRSIVAYFLRRTSRDRWNLFYV